MKNTTLSRPRSSARTLIMPVVLSALLMVGALPALAQDAAPAEPAESTPATESPPAADAAPAPQAFAPDAVVATVSGEAITEADLSFAAEDLGQELANIPPEDRRAFLLTVLIDMKVMADAARAAEMDKSDIFERRLRYLEDRALRRAYFAETITSAVTQETLQAAYDAYVAEFTPAEQVRARHILVATEADAEAIETELAAGVPFEQLAMTKSIDPSGAQNGGDLGFFSRGMMVPPFEEAAFALDVGAVSEPVQSQFGWHIIRVEEKGQSAPPTLAEIGPQIQQQLLFENFDEVVGGLKANAEIEIPDPALAAAVQAQSEAANQ